MASTVLAPTAVFRRTSRALGYLAMGLAAFCAVWPMGNPACGQRKAKGPRDVTPFRRQHADRFARFAAELEELASNCAERGLADAAGYVRLLAEPISLDELKVAALPRRVEEAADADLPEIERQWRARLKALRQDYAKDLYALSRQSLNAGHVSFAWDLVREVAAHDPDHAPARKMLGFVRSGEEWVSAFEARMMREKKSWHDRYGWIPRDHVDRYERGERYFKNRWISAEKEAELRRDFANAWEVRTEHYLVRTNHSLERGVELARKLESFHNLFFQLLAGFFTSQEQSQQLMAGAAGAKAAAKPNVVHYYRSREEYIAVLKRETNQPIEITKGIFFARNGIAFFFHDPDAADDSTLYHEATHQLLSRSRPQAGEIGLRGHFWAIEGIACYMESFKNEEQGFSVGDPLHGRIQSARFHFVQDRYYVPLREFSRMGMMPFQSAREIKKNYSQGAALVHFFMHYDAGRYREAFIEYLSQIYSPVKSVRDSPEFLDELIGVPAEELDAKYGQYVQVLGTRPASSNKDETASK